MGKSVLVCFISTQRDRESPVRLKLGNERLETVQTNSCGLNCRETLELRFV